LIAKAGVDGYGMKAAAEQMDNEGVRHIISLLHEAHHGPVVVEGDLAHNVRFQRLERIVGR